MNPWRVLSVLGTLTAVGLTGCFTTTRAVQKIQAPTAYQTASVQQVEKDLSDRDSAVKTLRAQVLITATTGGAKEGQVKEYTSFKGYIFVRKPADLRVIMQLPFLGSRALDMVSDGQTFTLMRASTHGGDIWMQGSDKVTKPSKNGLENLRPAVFLDSLLVPGVKESDLVTMTESTRLLPADAKHKEMISDPDYNVEVLLAKAGNTLELQRVVKIDRVTMLPYEQDIYDASGEIATQTTYEGYESFAGQLFPTVITIRRPLDEYSLKITVAKLTLNETFEADEFELQIPPGTVVQKME
jgi:outer membrane lipoprotein-sorting protein